MANSPYPEVRSSEELKTLPAGIYVECAGCVDMHRVTGDLDPVVWAVKHQDLRPWCNRFRITTITNFGVPSLVEKPAP